MAAPMDLNVLLSGSASSLSSLEEKVLMAQKLGYECIAINNVVEGMCQTIADIKKKDKITILPPGEILVPQEVLKKYTEKNARPIRQLSRISTILTDHVQTHVLTSPPVQRYDIVAVQPMTEKTFQLACTSLDVDIVTIDTTQRLGFNFKRSTLNKAMERGIYFEFQYSPAIRDKTMRKYLINITKDFVNISKGKNMILTSGCEKAFEMRAPHDVMNLGYLFDLNSAQVKDVITQNCRGVLHKAEARRIVKSTLSVENVSSMSVKDEWLLKKLDMTGSLDKPTVQNEDSNDKMSEEPASKKRKK